MHASVLFIGNPNCGKSTLFNALTGSNAKVANYPGITVEAKIGSFLNIANQEITIVDLPGTYSLIPASEEEEVTTKALLEKHSLVVVVIDINQLRRGLYLYLQVIELGFKAIIALNMADEAHSNKRQKILGVIKKSSGAHVILVNQEEKATLGTLKNTISAILAGSLLANLKEQPLLFTSLSKNLQDKLSLIPTKPFVFSKHAHNSEDIIKNISIFLINWHKKGVFKPNHKLDETLFSQEENEELEKLILNLPQERFLKVDAYLAELKSDDFSLRAWSDRLDKVFLAPILGPIILLFIFIFFLQAIFLLAQPVCDLVEQAINTTAHAASSLLPANSLVQSLLVDGIFAGLGTVLSFIPLIALLFAFLAILEDSGYMARATFLLDHRLKKLGLCGKSVAPMLSSFACAVPAIVATRTIASKKERLITIMVTPFITCSARLPVFALIVGALFSNYPPIFGFINIAALIFLSMYSLGLLAALCSAFMLSKIMKNNNNSSLSIDLPIFRIPKIMAIFNKVRDKISRFIKDIGGTILAATVVMWALFNLNFSLENNQYVLDKASNQQNSIAAMIGHKIEPAFSLMGADWQIGMGIMASFLAREVFVSSIAVAYGLENNQENDLKNTFKKNVSPLAGFSLLIFFTLAMQCISTVIVTKNETKSWFWAVSQFLFMTFFAYFLAVITYQGGLLWFG